MLLRMLRSGRDRQPAGAGCRSAGSAEPSRRRRSRGRSATRRAKQRKRSFWRDLVVIVVAALALTILLKAFVVQVFSIPTGSMENTLLPGDRILVSKIVYRFRPIDRGDIVVFSGAGSWDPATPPPANPLVRIWDDAVNLVGIAGPQTDYVKRVIGLPGDHVVCCNAAGQVTVNGVPLSEPSYIYPGAAPSEVRFNITVPAGQALGDGRRPGRLRRLALPANRPGQRHHPGERRGRPGLPDHLAAVPGHRLAHPGYLQASRAQRGRRDRHRAARRCRRRRGRRGRRRPRLAPAAPPLRGARAASPEAPVPRVAWSGPDGRATRKWRYARTMAIRSR